MLEVAINRTKDEVDDAITQFVARRSYRLSRPWYLEDVRVEAPQLNKDNADKPKGFWSSLVEEVTPYVDVEVKKKWRGTKVVIKPSAHQNSPLIGYDLQAFLHDERVYENICPPVCPRCANGVPNPGSHFCGRCGHRLAGNGGSMDRATERSDVLQPGGMMYEDAPLLTPDGLETPMVTEEDVLQPPPLVEMDEALDTDAEPVAVERDVENVARDEDEPNVVIEEAEEGVVTESPVAIERDDEELAVEQDASEVESEQLAEADNVAASEIEAESDHAADESVAVESTPMPEAEAEAIEEGEEDDDKDADSPPEIVEAGNEDDAATHQDANDDEVDTDEDEDPPYERRLLAED